MSSGIAIAVWAALRWSAQKTTELFTPGPSAKQREQFQQQATAMGRSKAQAKLERIQRGQQLAEDSRKGLLLTPEAAESLYQQGMVHWHRGEKQKAAELISRAARNGNENARVMANMHGIAF